MVCLLQRDFREGVGSVFGLVYCGFEVVEAAVEVVARAGDLDFERLGIQLSQTADEIFVLLGERHDAGAEIYRRFAACAHFQHGDFPFEPCERGWPSK